MWSGWLLTNKSGAVTGVHQRVDRLARRFVLKHTAYKNFPSIRDILYFEGKNGPDGIKAKSPANDEPWHYYDPFDEEDSQLIDLINDHYSQLVDAIKTDNYHRIAFEAAWLSHALVDGLTPAHHFPYEQELEKLRGESKETRTTIKKKLIIPGENKIELLINNWKMWGAKGLFTTHGLFELGIALVMTTMRYHLSEPTTYDYKVIHEFGVTEYFRRKAREVAMLNMYEDYYRYGWNAKLARVARDELVPAIIKTVSVAWYMALFEAGKIPSKVELVKT